MRKKLTRDAVEGAPVTGQRYQIWDTEVRGFGLRVGADGAKSYVLKYQVRRRQRYFTVGRAGQPWTSAKARERARALLGLVADGQDPAAERAKARAVMTVAELCDLYLLDGVATKRASTVATDRGRIERHIKPLIGRLSVPDVTSNDVRRFMRDIAEGKTRADVRTGARGRAMVDGGKGTATRTVGLLGGIFTFAVAEGMRADNPVHGVKRYPERKMERFLAPAELARLGEALRAAEAAAEAHAADVAAWREAGSAGPMPKASPTAEDPTAIAAIRMLVLTGCRKGEVLTLKWDHVDMAHGCLVLPESKTGQKVVPLGAPALELLAGRRPVDGNPYVFPSRVDMQGHLVGLPRVWEHVRAAAGLPGVRLHDLRHAFASVGAGAGLGLPIVGKLLGHRDPKTTARYAHVADSPARAAADRISGQVAAMMAGGAGGDVVQFRNSKAG